jgi:hypothetical protein
VRYATAAAFRQALDERLKTEDANTGLGLVRLRKRVAFELLLRRLVAVAPNRWVLKGALALDFRLDVATRPTMDIDLGRHDDERSAIEDLTAAQQIEMDDFFKFTVTKVENFAETDEFLAIRFRVRAELADRIFEQFILDIGFSGRASWTPDTICTSDFLSFAGIEQIEVPVIPLPQHIAEKVHAYTSTYGEAKMRSTRPKDLVDILLIARSEAVDAKALRRALENTFGSRQDQPLPTSLPEPPSSWIDPYRQLATGVGIEVELSVAFLQAATFLDPVLAQAIEGRWNSTLFAWGQ